MNLFRNILLWCSENNWMRENVPSYYFIKKAVKRFIPGEKVEDAFAESVKFNEFKIGNVFTYLGENITNLNEAAEVTNHYISVLHKINETELSVEISLKLTQIGFDFSLSETLTNFKKIIQTAKELNIVVWIDMEQSSYVERTIDFYNIIQKEYDNIGLCLQAYLLRTKDDLEKLFEGSPFIRLVKGAYKETKDIAFEKKSQVDENYFELAKILINAVKRKNIRAAFATHDQKLIGKIEYYAKVQNIERSEIEFQMLYGIKPSEQIRLAGENYKLLVLISYGDAWYPWYVRRLAERPANVGFVLKHLFTK